MVLHGDERGLTNLNSMELTTKELTGESSKILKDFSLLICSSKQSTVKFNEAIEKLKLQAFQSENNLDTPAIRVEIDGHSLRLAYYEDAKKFSIRIEKL